MNFTPGTIVAARGREWIVQTPDADRRSLERSRRRFCSEMRFGFLCGRERGRCDPLAISHLPLAPTSSCRS